MLLLLQRYLFFPVDFFENITHNIHTFLYLYLIMGAIIAPARADSQL